MRRNRTASPASAATTSVAHALPSPYRLPSRNSDPTTKRPFPGSVALTFPHSSELRPRPQPGFVGKRSSAGGKTPAARPSSPPPRSAGCGHCLRATPRRKEPPSGAVERPPSFPAGKGGPIPFDRSRQRKEPIPTRPRNAAPERYAPNASPPAGEPTDGKPPSRESVALSTPARHRKTKTRPGKHERTKYKKAVRFANGLMSFADRPYSEFT